MHALLRQTLQGQGLEIMPAEGPHLHRCQLASRDTGELKTMVMAECDSALPCTCLHGKCKLTGNLPVDPCCCGQL
jgi:hypothetical protein